MHCSGGGGGGIILYYLIIYITLLWYFATYTVYNYERSLGSFKASIRSHFPLSDLQPVFIVWNQETGVAYFLELAVCLGSNSSTSTEQKVVKYAELVVVCVVLQPF